MTGLPFTITFFSSLVLIYWMRRKSLTNRRWSSLMELLGNPPLMLRPLVPFIAGDSNGFLNYKHFLLDLRTSIINRNVHMIKYKILIFGHVELEAFFEVLLLNVFLSVLLPSVLACFADNIGLLKHIINFV